LNLENQRLAGGLTMHRIAMLGTGLIGRFYTMALQSHRRRDRVELLFSRSPQRAEQCATEWGVPRHASNLKEAICDPEIDVVVVALPNHLHEEAVLTAAEAGKAVLVTKPLGRNGAEALRMLQACEKAGIFHGYLEDLVYTPKTLKAIESVQQGALGDILWVRSRETHSGPHSDWFWNKELSGGGAITDLGCHCIQIARSFIGKDVRPVEVTCWADTQVHPIEAEDHGIGLVRYENGAIGQFEVSWCFRGGMDLRDEISGTQGTIWLNHWLRTGFDMFTAVGQNGYVSEKTELNTGWLFPVGDECNALGYQDMFTDMFESIDGGTPPRETLYDGYVVNAIIDACYAAAQSKKWEPVQLPIWRGNDQATGANRTRDFDSNHTLIKEERMPDGSSKLILRDKQTGEIVQRAG
jgi:predicted dehydrogenase